MSNTKEKFISLCQDAADQYSLGIKLSTIQENIAYLAETQGMPMVKAIDFATTMNKSIVDLKKQNEPVNAATVARQFLKNMSSPK